MLQRGGLNLTAVTVTTENNHTIAFLGTSDGQVLKVKPQAGAGQGRRASPQEHPSHTPAFVPKVYLAPNGSSVEYGSILVEINKRVKRDLVLSADGASVYAMTQDKVGLGRGLAPGHCDRPRGVQTRTRRATLSLCPWQHLHPGL